MPEPKKQPTIFDAEVDDQLGGLHLARAKRPAAPKTGTVHKATGASAGEIQSPEPALVSKLIDFIKSI